MHKSKSSGSNQVSFHKQMQRERGIFEQQGESQGCDTGKILRETSLLQNSGSSPSGFLGAELREWLQSLPNRDFILRRGRSSRLLQTNAKRCIDHIPLRNHTPGRPGCLAIINSWLNSPAGSTGNTVPAATDSDSEKVHWRKSIHGKNESEGHSVGISLFTEK